MAISSPSQQSPAAFLTIEWPSLSVDEAPMRNPAFDWSGLNAAAAAAGAFSTSGGIRRSSKKVREKHGIFRRSLTSSWLFPQDENNKKAKAPRRGPKSRRRPLLKSSGSKPVPYAVSATTPGPSVVFFPTNEDKGCGEAASVGMLHVHIHQHERKGIHLQGVASIHLASLP